MSVEKHEMFEGTRQLHRAISLASFISGIFTFSLIAGCGDTSTSNEEVRNTSLNTYVDPRSSLEWIAFWDENYIGYLSHDDINSYCDTLTANDKSDWRMPSADETLDYLMHNTEIRENNFEGTQVVSTHSTSFKNPLLPPEDTDSYYSDYTGPPLNIVFQIVPHISYYDDDYDSKHFGSVSIYTDNPDDPHDIPDPDNIYYSNETLALKAITQNGIYETWEDRFYEFTCVRGTHRDEKIPLGTWVNVENEAEIKSTGQYAYSVTLVDDRHIRLSTIMYQGSYTTTDGRYVPAGLIIDENAHYISSGIPDVRVKGQIRSFAEASSVHSIASIDIILGCLTNKEPQYCQELVIKPATPDNPHNTYEEATEDGESNILYVTQDAEGNYILDSDNPITIASGKITIALTDSAGNTAIFTIEVAGEDTDVGVLNIPDIQTLYNFKTTIDHGTDYIYHGYNVGETQVAYSKQLSICNVGTASISGTTFNIEVDPDNVSVVRSFSHTYDGSSLGFSAGSCENYTVNFEFFRPVEDTEVKFNITITDHFNGLTWHDYTTFRLSQHEPVNVYFASNSQPLEGFLVAPGNQLVRVEFSEYEYQQNFVRVPTYKDSEYHVVLYASSVEGEDTYMITTTDPPVRSKMDGFSDVYAYEPNDTSLNATVIPLQLGEVISYLHSGDMDFFTLKESP
jgi:hypothetical protein